VPAGNVVPGTDTGPLNVTYVSRSLGCAIAGGAVSSAAAKHPAVIDVIRPICLLLVYGCPVHCENLHAAYRLAVSTSALQ
jgi:hypothetical protein